jgi:exodeoxyribonuclease VII large subunit
MTAMFFMLLVQLSTEWQEVQGSLRPALPRVANAAVKMYPRAMAAPAAERVFTVSEITERVKAVLEDGFPWVTVQGEISNFRPSSTGHYYFSLKDNEAMLSVVMFRNRLAGLRFEPADGQLVRASGSISVYAKRGNYQLVCESLARAGEGEILAMLEERKRRLAAEGLFDEGRKKPLPLFPSRVGVITSPTGAAIRDILRILARRNAGIDVVVLPAPVQGEGADERIARRIETANRFSMADVLIVGRGGGSLEDLLPFSSERVVRAIAASRIPVISAVGHETDVSLADFAADVRAPTPSAAAELVAASRVELAQRVRALESDISSAAGRRLERVRLLLAQFTAANLARTVGAYLQPLFQALDDSRDGLVRAMSDRVRDSAHRLALAARGMASCSPLDILQRGYAVVSLERTRKVLLSAERVRKGDVIRVRLARGGLRATTEETYAGEEL